MFCPLILVFGRNRYHRSPPTGSVFGTFLKLLAYATKGRLSLNPVKTYKRMTADDFWEGAKPSKIVKRGEKLPLWMDFNDQWVDEVRRGVKACGVFVWFPVYCESLSILFLFLMHSDLQKNQYFHLIS